MAREPTQVYSGRYEIIRRLARGGMAEVYLARDQLLDRRVALKVLFPELSIDPNFVERFRREAQAAANLSHPNIVSVFDWGEEAGTYFIVMEYVDGVPLSALIGDEGPLLPDRAAAIAADVAAALAFAHRNGVVHRDVKPGNVLIDASGHVKVADFGIARAANTQENLTQTGAVMGTATYFSPEQAQGFGVDARSDVYSLGVVLYEMVTGAPPFSGDNAVTIAYKHVREQPEPPSARNPAIPPAFEAIVLQAMDKEPEDRYASADDLRADLLRYRQGRRVMATPPATAILTRSQPATRAMPAVDAEGTRAMSSTVVGPPPPPPRRTGAYIALLFIMLAALAVLLFLLGRSLGIIGDEDSAAQVVVPSVIGETADQAEKTLRDMGLDVQRQLENNEADVNVVFDQDPEANTRVDKGSRVTIKVSQGERPVAVPDVVGEDEQDARDLLERLGFNVSVRSQADDDQPAGRVISQDPRAQTPLARGETVRLVVSTGKPLVKVPDVRGKDLSDAANELSAAGLKVGRRTLRFSSEPKGTVLDQSPKPDEQAEKGSSVDLVVSDGPEPSTTTSTTLPGTSTSSTSSTTTSTTTTTTQP